MKIYLFCPETGIYQGEDFADECSMRKERQGLPAGATIIAPPPFERGEVPIFHFAKNHWEVRRRPLGMDVGAAKEGPPPVGPGGSLWNSQAEP